MKDSYYVIFNKRGIDRFCKSGGFTLKAGEYAVEMNLEIPDEIFKPVRIPTVKVTVDPDAIRKQYAAEQEPVEGEIDG